MFKRTFEKWVLKIGANEAKARLMKRGLGASTIERMVGGTYAHEPRGLTLAVIAEELMKDGFSLAGGKAS